MDAIQQLEAARQKLKRRCKNIGEPVFELDQTMIGVTDYGTDPRLWMTVKNFIEIAKYLLEE